MNPDWIEHRRSGDRELLGWIVIEDDGFVAVDLLGRRRTDVVDWLTAEETLDAAGMGYLAEAYELKLDDGRWLAVRLTEVSPEAIKVMKDDRGAVDAPQLHFTLPFPMPARLRVCELSL
jgi:hypothetical protein